MTSSDEAHVDTPGRADSARSARFYVGVLALVVIAAALRVTVMEQTYPVELLGDEVYYASVKLPKSCNELPIRNVAGRQQLGRFENCAITLQ